MLEGRFARPNEKWKLWMQSKNKSLLYTHSIYSNVVLDRVLIVISLDRISTNLDWIKLNLHFPLCNVVYDIYTGRITRFSYDLMRKSENLMKTSEFLMISLVFHWKSKYSRSLSKNTITILYRYLSLKLLGTYMTLPNVPS